MIVFRLDSATQMSIVAQNVNLERSEKVKCSRLRDVRQRIVDRTLFGLAFVFVEVGLQLKLGLIGVNEKLLSSPKRQAADVAIGKAGRGPDEAGDLETPVRHGSIMARCSQRVKCDGLRDAVGVIATLTTTPKCKAIQNN